MNTLANYYSLSLSVEKVLIHQYTLWWWANYCVIFTCVNNHLDRLVTSDLEFTYIFMLLYLWLKWTYLESDSRLSCCFLLQSRPWVIERKYNCCCFSMKVITSWHTHSSIFWFVTIDMLLFHHKKDIYRQYFFNLLKKRSYFCFCAFLWSPHYYECVCSDFQI